MTIEITTDELKAIYVTSLADASLEAFIDTAISLVTNKLANSGLTEAVQKNIALFMSAHLASSMEPRKASESFDGYSHKVQGTFAMGLNSTSYGQNVLLLDTSGTMNTLGKKTLGMLVYEVDRDN